MKISVMIGQILSVNFMATKIKTNKMIKMIKALVTSSIFFQKCYIFYQFSLANFSHVNLECRKILYHLAF